MDLDAIVYTLSNNHCIFTAYDVTRILRQHNPHTNIQHIPVRKQVHKLQHMGLMGVYTKTAQHLGNQIAQVFHPIGKNPTEYDPSRFLDPTEFTNLTPYTSASTLPIPPSIVTEYRPKGNTTVRNYDGDYRVFVPPSYCRAIGLFPGMQAYFTIKPKQVSIYPLPGPSRIAGIHVQSRGHFRINQKTLQQADLSACQYPFGLTITKHKNRISINP